MQLTSPLKKSLAAKRKALESPAGYRDAAAYNVADVHHPGHLRDGRAVPDAGSDLLASERPKKLSADEREQYDALLEEQAKPFEEQAIAIHEADAVRARDGVYDDGVRASYQALAEILPGRYGKTEAVGTWTNSLVLPQKLPAAETAAPVLGAAVSPAPLRSLPLPDPLRAWCRSSTAR